MEIGPQRLGSPFKKTTGKQKPKKGKPSTTDSLAVYMTNNDSKSSFAPISRAAKKRYGNIDVKDFNPSKMGKYNVKEGRKKYNIK